MASFSAVADCDECDWCASYVLGILAIFRSAWHEHSHHFNLHRGLYASDRISDVFPISHDRRFMIRSVNRNELPNVIRSTPKAVHLRAAKKRSPECCRSVEQRAKSGYIKGDQ
jgi:hypothetical protein